MHLRGLIKGGIVSFNSPVFTLPADYRPAAQELFSTLANSQAARVDVKSNGQVVVVLGTNQWVNLDGLSFRAAN